MIMAWYEKRWWKKLLKKEQEPKEDSIKDLTAVIEYIESINDEAELLLPELKKLEELETERQVASSGLAQVNLEAQAVILDKILKEYGFFQNDVDINGIRVKRIAKEFLKQAKKAGLKDLVKEKEKDNNWRFNW